MSSVIVGRDDEENFGESSHRRNLGLSAVNLVSRIREAALTGGTTLISDVPMTMGVTNLGYLGVAQIDEMPQFEIV